MVKPTKHGLRKLEYVFEGLGYQIRYAKGNFHSGYCLIHEQRIAVINKYFDTEGRFFALQEILQGLEITENDLEPAYLKVYREFEKTFVRSEVEPTQ